ncbi:MAG: hypothetical protein ACKO96_09495 [Flammeovirgaceae bacterium]
MAAYYCGRFVLVVVRLYINYGDAAQKELVKLQKVVFYLPTADVDTSMLQLHL